MKQTYRLLGLVLALVLAFAWTPLASAQEVTPSVTVADQEIVDGTVTVAEVVAAQDGWIVIHADQDGSIGPVIGHTAVSAGTNSDVTVQIDTEAATETLYAMLHVDAGEVGTYEFPGPDGPVVVDGAPVSPAFQATSAMMEEEKAQLLEEFTPSIQVRDQVVNEQTVTIPQLFINVAGWVVLHVDEEGAPGPVIGHAAVEAGPNYDVQVPLDEAVANGTTLWAMLHVDEGEAGVYEFPGPDSPVKVDDETVMAPFVVLQPAVQISDQDTADNTITAEGVVAAADGWLVIHESNEDGTVKVPENIGFAPIAPGTTPNVKVLLDKEVEDGAKLWAMLHFDAGEKGTYEFPGPDEPVSVDDEIVMTPFVVNAPAMAAEEVTPSVTVADQEIVDGTVTVAEVVAAQDGWIVIHADQDGSIGPVIGHTAVSAGTNSDVTVQIDTEAATETLYAMLHVDAGEVGTYEFPGPDGPVVVDGAPVSPAFQAISAMMEEEPGGAPEMLPTTGASLTDQNSYSPWLLIALVAVVLAAGALWFRRRTV